MDVCEKHSYFRVVLKPVNSFLAFLCRHLPENGYRLVAPKRLVNRSIVFTKAENTMTFSPLFQRVLDHFDGVTTLCKRQFPPSTRELTDNTPPSLTRFRILIVSRES